MELLRKNHFFFNSSFFFGENMSPFVRPRDILAQRLTENGDGTGNANANQDYSGGSLTKFFVQPANDQSFELHTFGIIIRTATAFEAGEYGDGAELEEGISLTIEDDTGIIHDFLAGDKIRVNAGWGIILLIDSIISSPNSPALLTGSDAFRATVGDPIRIVGSLNQRIVITLNDNMTTRLTDQEFAVTGQKVV